MRFTLSINKPWGNQAQLLFMPPNCLLITMPIDLLNGTTYISKLCSSYQIYTIEPMCSCCNINFPCYHMRAVIEKLCPLCTWIKQSNPADHYSAVRTPIPRSLQWPFLALYGGLGLTIWRALLYNILYENAIHVNPAIREDRNKGSRWKGSSGE